jgi:hypothetical protein
MDHLNKMGEQYHYRESDHAPDHIRSASSQQSANLARRPANLNGITFEKLSFEKGNCGIRELKELLQALDRILKNRGGKRCAARVHIHNNSAVENLWAPSAVPPRNDSRYF